MQDTQQPGIVCDSEELINQNLKLIYDVAKRYESKLGIDRDELIGYGYEGLFMAATRFDPNKTENFVAYATSYINGYILNAISTLKGFSYFHLYSKFLEIKKKFYKDKKVSFDITEDSFLENLEVLMQSTEVKQLQKGHFFTMLSLLMSDTYDKHIDTLVTRDSDPTFNAVYYQQVKTDLNQAMAKLSDKEREILKYRYCLDGYSLYSLSELSKMFHMTIPGIAASEKRSLEKLKRFIKSDGNVMLEFFDQTQEFNRSATGMNNYQKCKINH